MFKIAQTKSKNSGRGLMKAATRKSFKMQPIKLNALDDTDFSIGPSSSENEDDKIIIEESYSSSSVS